MRYERIGRVVRVLAGVVVAALALWKVTDLVLAEPQVGHWRTAEAQQRYLEARADVLRPPPAPDVETDVRTSFGTVHVIGWTASGGRDLPVLLVPGHSSGAVMWSENLPDWIGKRTVYAIDPLGDAGLSAQSRPLRSPVDQADVLAEVLDGLQVPRAHVVGHSFGGAVAAQFAVSHPRRVASLALLEPVMALRPMPASVYLWASVLALPAPQSWKDRALAEIGGTTVDEVRERTPMSRLVDAASSGYSTAMPMPREVTDEQWRALPMPVRLDIGGASELAGGQAAADRLRALQPDATVTVWPGGTHSLPMDEHAALDPKLLDFWAQHS